MNNSKAGTVLSGFWILLCLLTGACEKQYRTDDKRKELATSPCGHFDSVRESAHKFPEFEFINGYWKCDSILECRGGSLYTDSLLQLARSSYLCANLPFVRFYTVNSFGMQVYESGVIDTIQWEKSAINDEDHLVTGSLRCNFRMDRKEVKRFSTHHPNYEQWFEYISDDTIGFFYDSYFFILTKQR